MASDLPRIVVDTGKEVLTIEYDPNDNALATKLMEIFISLREIRDDLDLILEDVGGADEGYYYFRALRVKINNIMYHISEGRPNGSGQGAQTGSSAVIGEETTKEEAH
jgi:hypothetical protein